MAWGTCHFQRRFHLQAVRCTQDKLWIYLDISMPSGYSSLRRIYLHFLKSLFEQRHIAISFQVLLIPSPTLFLLQVLKLLKLRQRLILVILIFLAVNIYFLSFYLKNLYWKELFPLLFLDWILPRLFHLKYREYIFYLWSIPALHQNMRILFLRHKLDSLYLQHLHIQFQFP